MSSSPPGFSSIVRALALLVGAFAGLVVFIYYFLPSPTMSQAAGIVLDAVLLLVAAAMFLAAFHLVWRHAGRVAQTRLSALVLAGFALAFAGGLLDGYQQGLGGWIFRWVISPGLAAVFALLPIFLAYALIRHLNTRELGMALFALSFLVVLLGQTPMLAERFPLLAAMRHNVLIGPATAAFRGLLLGLALGLVLALIMRFWGGGEA
ncbi:MAG: hypothetical protein GXP42_09835 [Chloroflexi bacterium]|nr:hypothetical protein [Chloroflexota bacterium]